MLSTFAKQLNKNHCLSWKFNEKMVDNVGVVETEVGILDGVVQGISERDQIIFGSIALGKEEALQNKGCNWQASRELLARKPRRQQWRTRRGIH